MKEMQLRSSEVRVASKMASVDGELKDFLRKENIVCGIRHMGIYHLKTSNRSTESVKKPVAMTEVVFLPQLFKQQVWGPGTGSIIPGRENRAIISSIEYATSERLTIENNDQMITVYLVPQLRLNLRVL